MSPVRAGTGGLGERLLEGQQGQGVTDTTSSTFCEKKKKNAWRFSRLACYLWLGIKQLLPAGAAPLCSTGKAPADGLFPMYGNF